MAANSEGRPRVGFIGLGTMGRPMASNIQAAGYPLVVSDLHESAAADRLAAGATWARTPAELAAQVDVVFTSLPGPAEIESVALGADGLFESMAPGSAWFELSTSSPTLIRELHAQFARRDVHVLDAPISGGPGGAKSRALAVWVGGEQDIFDQHLGLIGAISDAPSYIGAIGAGLVAKLVHNAAAYIIQTGLAEVFTLGVKAGVEPAALFSAVRQGAAGRRRTFDFLPLQFLKGSYEQVTFSLTLAHKDVSLATSLAREHGVPMRLAQLALEEMTEALNRGWGGLDSRVPMALQEERAGVEVRVPEELIAGLLD